MRTSRLAGAMLTGVVVVLGVTGCSVKTTVTVPASNVAKGAAGDPTKYDSVVTISQVKGTAYHVAIKVDSPPEN